MKPLVFPGPRPDHSLARSEFRDQSPITVALLLPIRSRSRPSSKPTPAILRPVLRKRIAVRPADASHVLLHDD